MDDQIALEPETFPAKLAGFCLPCRCRAGRSVVVVVISAARTQLGAAAVAVIAAGVIVVVSHRR